MSRSKVSVVLGAQWGDEGKGKIVDFLAAGANLVARYGGGANAGHTLQSGETRVITHLLPSGILNPGVYNLIGNGVVIDPKQLLFEMNMCMYLGVKLSRKNLGISEKAHVVFPHHKDRDINNEESSNAVGSTKRGIGPAYSDKSARVGVQMWELTDPAHLRKRLGDLVDEETIDEYISYGETLALYLCDASKVANQYIKNSNCVLIEGAQGVLLDLDHGTYPFVTSSATAAGGACTGLGIGPTSITEVIGVSKAYTTRVGGGPFPTELKGKTGELLQDIGNEYGATTGRPRKCGWLDLVALRHAVRVGGITQLAITKLDVLAELENLHACVEYILPSGKGTEDFPANLSYIDISPRYVELSAFGISMSELAKIRRFEDLPDSVQNYLNFISDFVKVPITIISVGPGRDETIVRR